MVNVILKVTIIIAKTMFLKFFLKANPYDTKVTSLESSSTRAKAAYDNEMYISNAIVHEIR